MLIPSHQDSQIIQSTNEAHNDFYRGKPIRTGNMRTTLTVRPSETKDSSFFYPNVVQ